jgi:hypothetical protein
MKSAKDTSIINDIMQQTVPFLSRLRS